MEHDRPATSSSSGQDHAETAKKRKAPDDSSSPSNIGKSSDSCAAASSQSSAGSGPSSTHAEAPRQINYDELGTAKYLDEDDVKAAEELRHERTLAGSGTAGSNEGQFYHLRHIAVDHEDNIVVADCSNHRLQIVSSDGGVIRVIGRQGEGDGQFQYPEGVCLDQNRQIFVADVYNDRIQVFGWEGKHLRTFGSRGSGPTQLNRPRGITVSKQDGLVYVCDRNNHRVQVFTAGGDHVRTIGADQLSTPHGIALDEQDNAYIADWLLHCVFVYSKDGTLIRRFGSYGTDDGCLNYPQSICMDEHRGHVVVGDNNGIQIYKKEDCSFVCKLGDKTFRTTGVCVDSQGRIIASNYSSHTIERWA